MRATLIQINTENQLVLLYESINMKKGKKSSEGRSHRLSLTSNPGRTEARKISLERTKEAAKTAGFKLRALRVTTVDEYFQWRQKNDPELVKFIREYHMGSDTACQWCEGFRTNAFAHCLHCGKVFISKVTPPSP